LYDVLLVATAQRWLYIGLIFVLLHCSHRVWCWFSVIFVFKENITALAVRARQTRW
jgi:hypothetical protein